MRIFSLKSLCAINWCGNSQVVWVQFFLRNLHTEIFSTRELRKPLGLRGLPTCFF